MELKDLSFGNPIRQQLIYLKSENYLDSLLNELSSYPYPPNDSDTSTQELHKLVEYVNTFSQTNDASTTKRLEAFEDFENFMIKTLVNEGLSEQDVTDTISELHKDITPLLVKLKYHYQRIRPHTLAFYKEIPLYPLDSCTAYSPSYPSGHAYQSIIYAEVLGNKYPQYYIPLKNMAVDISNSRLFKGLHYDSDLQFANYAAQLVLNHPEFRKKYKL
jgi:hypothetical protein